MWRNEGIPVCVCLGIFWVIFVWFSEIISEKKIKEITKPISGRILAHIFEFLNVLSGKFPEELWKKFSKKLLEEFFEESLEEFPDYFWKKSRGFFFEVFLVTQSTRCRIWCRIWCKSGGHMGTYSGSHLIACTHIVCWLGYECVVESLVEPNEKYLV